MRHRPGAVPARRIEQQLGITFTVDSGIRDWVEAEFSARRLFASPLHGYPHWLSVYANARELCRGAPGLEPGQAKLVLVAACLHDVGRLSPGASQGFDIAHGREAERVIRTALPAVARRFTSADDVAAIGLLARAHIDDAEPVRRRLARTGLDAAADIVRDADSLDYLRLEILEGEEFDPTHLRLGAASARLIPAVRARWQAWLH